MEVSAASTIPTASVVVTLAFFLLVAYLVSVLRTTHRPAAVITAIAALVGALPAILYALHYTVSA